MKLIDILKEIQIKGFVTPKEVFDLWDDVIVNIEAYTNGEAYIGTTLARDYDKYISFKHPDEINDLEFLTNVSKQKLQQYYKELQQFK